MIIQLLTHYTKPILKSLIITNFLPRRVKCGGTEEEIVVAHSCRKRKKLICGTEGEIVVAHGRLPSPALKAVEQSFGRHFLKKIMIIVSVDGTASITSSDK